ncbi:MAG: leucine-rich repeat protein, partial [Lachnospiraceae bacterium]|nr:leucine-rich repeat protein [Lachnospiraceae bacterium]
DLCETTKWTTNATETTPATVVAGINKDRNLYVFGEGSYYVSNLYDLKPELAKDSETGEEIEKFEGWYEDNELTTQINTGLHEMTAGSIIYSKIVAKAPEETTATLTYNANGHGKAPAAVTMETSTSTVVANAITAYGYTFKEWNTEADGTGTKYKPGDEINAQGNNPTDITLYAQWASYQIVDTQEGTKLVISERITKENASDYPWYELRASIAEIEINSDVKVIGQNSFNGFSNLKKVILPDGLETISSGAFGDCTSLESINIPNTVVNIYSNAFMNCKKLANIIIPSSVKKLYSRAFMGCDNLKSIIINDGVEEIGYAAFKNCTALENIIIPESVNTFEQNDDDEKSQTFYGCTKLKNVAILHANDTEDNKFLIGKDAFKNTDNNLTIYCKNGVSALTGEGSAYKGLCETTKWTTNATETTPATVVAGINKKDGNLYVFGNGSIDTDKLPAQTVETGKQFIGWTDREGGEVITTETVEAEKTLYAKVRDLESGETTATLTYNANGHG